jgi:tetratricopeptide (TPR) repeat protein
MTRPRSQQLVLAEGLARQLQVAPAIEACHRVLELDAKDPLAHALCADLYAYGAFWGKAVEHATVAIESDPDCLPAYLPLGLAYDALGIATDQAILVWHELAELVPDMALPQALLAEAYLTIHHFDEALNAVEMASNIDGEWARPHFTAALIHQMRGEADKAEDAWARARERDSAGEDLFYNLNRIPQIDTTRSPSPEPPWPDDLQERLRLAEALLRDGQLNDASAVAKSVANERPESDRALGDLAAIHLKQEMANEALILSRRAVDINDQNLGARHILATCYARRTALLPLAAELWDGIVASEPRHAVVHTLAAEARLALGDEDAAVSGLFRAVDIDAAQPRPYYALASLYLVSGMYAQARATWRRAGALSLPSGVFWDLYNRVVEAGEAEAAPAADAAAAPAPETPASPEGQA